MKPLLVGEANPYQSDPQLAQHFALYPDPPGCAGWRLCKLVMGLEPEEYLKRFDRVNLCDGKWGMKEARARAIPNIQIDAAKSGRAVVLFGAKVMAAFAMNYVPFTVIPPLVVPPLNLRPTFVCLPHPSGLSRAWNEPGAFERARGVLRKAGVL